MPRCSRAVSRPVRSLCVRNSINAGRNSRPSRSKAAFVGGISRRTRATSTANHPVPSAATTRTNVHVTTQPYPEKRADRSGDLAVERAPHFGGELLVPVAAFEQQVEVEQVVGRERLADAC